MFNNHGASGSNSSGKGMMKEIAVEEIPAPRMTIPVNHRFDNRVPQHLLPSYVPRVPLFGCLSSSHARNVLNKAASQRHFSFTSLLNSPDPEEYLQNSGFLEPSSTSEQLHGIISQHSNNWKHPFSEMVEQLAEEQAAKKVQLTEQSEARKLQAMADIVQAQASRIQELEETVEDLEDTVEEKFKSTEELLVQLKRSTALALNTWRTYQRMYSAGIIDVNEDEGLILSSCEDPEREEQQVRLDCKVCFRKGMAKIVIQHCRHICVCTECEPFTINCPVCDILKEDSFEVSFAPEYY